MSTIPAAAAQSGDRLDRGLLLVASIVVLGAVMSILDTAVVNVAINTLARDFETPLSTIQWVATGYTLALATVIPLTGWAASAAACHAGRHDDPHPGGRAAPRRPREAPADEAPVAIAMH